jgi:hypothetical protein
VRVDGGISDAQMVGDTEAAEQAMDGWSKLFTFFGKHLAK